jgi:hypothetical protein
MTHSVIVEADSQVPRAIAVRKISNKSHVSGVGLGYIVEVRGECAVEMVIRCLSSAYFDPVSRYGDHRKVVQDCQKHDSDGREVPPECHSQNCESHNESNGCSNTVHGIILHSLKDFTSAKSCVVNDGETRRNQHNIRS